MNKRLGKITAIPHIEMLRWIEASNPGELDHPSSEVSFSQYSEKLTKRSLQSKIPMPSPAMPETLMHITEEFSRRVDREIQMCIDNGIDVFIDTQHCASHISSDHYGTPTFSYHFYIREKDEYPRIFAHGVTSEAIDEAIQYAKRKVFALID